MTIFLTILQILCAVGAGVLDYLSHFSVGVNHYVVFKKYEAFRTFLRPEKLPLYRAAGIAAVAIVMVLLILGIRRKSSGACIRELAVLELLTVLPMLELTVPSARNLPIYLYLLALTGMAWALQILKVLFVRRRKK